MNPLVDATRGERWETGVPELNMQQLRAPEVLGWLKTEAKPSSMSLGTFVLRSMFNATLAALTLNDHHREVIRQYVRTWPDLLTAVLREAGYTIIAPASVTVGRTSDSRQNASGRRLDT